MGDGAHEAVPQNGVVRAVPRAGVVAMKIAHLADLHLGFRRYDRSAPGGVNQREQDVYDSFNTAVKQIETAGPDLVVVAGDVFHSVTPPNRAILTAYQGFARLAQVAPVCLVAGDHDTPRTRESAPILALLRAIPRVKVAIDEADSYWDMGFPHQVSLWPDLALRRRAPEFAAEPLAPAGAIIVAHGGAEGFQPHPTLWKASLRDCMVGALGHYHSCAEVAPNAWYAGSLDYTSSDPWHESASKGWLLWQFDYDRGPVLQPVPVRPHIDLPPILAPAWGDVGKFLEVVTGQVERVQAGSVTRLRLVDVPADWAAVLPFDAIREAKGRALHFQLEVKRPRSGPVAEGPVRVREKLRDVVANFMRERGGDVLADEATRYFDEVSDGHGD
jgi:exonuclease SbcD